MTRGILSEHLRSNVVGYIAVFLALSGTAVALPGKNKVDSGDIKNGEVKNPDVAADAVTGDKVAPDTLTGDEVADTDSLGTPEINEGTLFNDNSLDGADVNENDLFNDNSLDGADVNEGTLFGDNSLDAADVNEGSLAGAGLAGGQTLFAHENRAANQTFTVLNAPGRFRIDYTCPAAPSSQDGAITFHNLRPQAELFTDSGGADPAYNPFGGPASIPFPANRAGDRYEFTFLLLGVAPTVIGRATIDVRQGGSQCLVLGQALISG